MDITGRIWYIEGYNHDLVITKDKYLEIYPKCGYNCGNIQKTAKFPVMLWKIDDFGPFQESMVKISAKWEK